MKMLRISSSDSDLLIVAFIFRKGGKKTSGEKERNRITICFSFLTAKIFGPAVALVTMMIIIIPHLVTAVASSPASVTLVPCYTSPTYTISNDNEEIMISGCDGQGQAGYFSASK